MYIVINIVDEINPCLSSIFFNRKNMNLNEHLQSINKRTVQGKRNASQFLVHPTSKASFHFVQQWIHNTQLHT